MSARYVMRARSGAGAPDRSVPLFADLALKLSNKIKMHNGKTERLQLVRPSDVAGEKAVRQTLPLSR